MTLIIGARCRDGIVLAADRRRLSKYEKGPLTNSLAITKVGWKNHSDMRPWFSRYHCA